MKTRVAANTRLQFSVSWWLSPYLLRSLGLVLVGQGEAQQQARDHVRSAWTRVLGAAKKQLLTLPGFGAVPTVALTPGILSPLHRSPCPVHSVNPTDPPRRVWAGEVG